jgi:hypothetical protein
MRRERNSSCHSDDMSMKRHRPDSGMMGPNINNNNLDIINHMPQITATDFSTNIKHMNSMSPHIKDSDRMDVKTPNGELSRARSKSFSHSLALRRKQQQHAQHEQQCSQQQQQQLEGFDQLDDKRQWRRQLGLVDRQGELDTVATGTLVRRREDRADGAREQQHQPGQ